MEQGRQKYEQIETEGVDKIVAMKVYFGLLEIMLLWARDVDSNYVACTFNKIV